MELTEQLKQKVANYHPSAQVTGLLNSTPILLLVAISGGGKDTIKHRLLATGDYQHIISHTTRAPRKNNGTLEHDGVDYHFIDIKTAEEMLNHGMYIESDVYAGNVYGTAMHDIELAKKEGKVAITDVTIEGALHYLKLAPQVKVVFLLPPSYKIWMERLIARYGGITDGHDMRLRLEEAVDEIEHALASDAIYIVVNDDLEKTVELVDAIGHNKPIEPHYAKAMGIAHNLLGQLKEELGKLA